MKPSARVKKKDAADVRKRLRNERLKNILHNYLRRRRFMEGEQLKRSDLVLTQTRKQMSVAATVAKNVSRQNSILYTGIDTDLQVLEQHFAKLKSWVLELPEGKCKRELYPLLFPLLCHSYIDILRGGLPRRRMSNFLKRQRDPFLSDETYRPMLDELSTIFTARDVNDSKPLMKAFRSCRFLLKISTATLRAFEKFMLAEGHLVLLQTIQTWFEIEELSSDSVIESEEGVPEVRPKVGKGPGTHPPRPRVVGTGPSQLQNAAYLEALFRQSHEDRAMGQLKEAIRLVRLSPTPPPPLLLYTMVHSESMCCARVSGTGKLLATGYSNSLIKMWSMSESKIKPASTHHATVHLATNTQPYVQLVREQRQTTLRGHSGPVTGVDFLHNAEVMLSVSHDSTMRAWRLADYSNAAVYRGHNSPVWGVAVSCLGIYIATASHDRTVRLWNLDRTHPLRTFAGHSEGVNCVQFHPNGSYIATGSCDRSIRLWSVTDGKMMRVFSGNCGNVLAVAFSPNGRHLASGGDDCKVKVWDLATGGMLAQFQGHSRPVSALAWSKNSKFLASASMDGTVLGWNSTPRIKSPINSGSGLPSKYTTKCASLVSLQCLPRGSLIGVGRLERY